MTQQNFPVPRFSGDPSWPNRWNLSNTETASIGLKGSRRITLKKTESYTVHAILNGDGDDINRLSEGHGVPVAPETAYSAQISGERTGDLRVQLAVHEFSASGERIGRELVDLDAPALYVPQPGTERLILTMRMRGWGNFMVRRLGFEPVEGVRGAEPGTHTLEAPEPQEHMLDAENFADLKQIMLHSPAFHEQLAAAAGARTEQSIAELRAAQEELRGGLSALAERSERTLALLEDIQRRLAAHELRQAFASGDVDVDVLDSVDMPDSEGSCSDER